MKIQQLFEEYYEEYVVSSNLDHVGYDDEKEVLDITFLSGSTYRYYDVPYDVYQGLVDATSKGRFFWRNIRNDFNYQRL